MWRWHLEREGIAKRRNVATEKKAAYSNVVSAFSAEMSEDWSMKTVA